MELFLDPASFGGARVFLNQTKSYCYEVLVCNDKFYLQILFFSRTTSNGVIQIMLESANLMSIPNMDSLINY